MGDFDWWLGMGGSGPGQNVPPYDPGEWCLGEVTPRPPRYACAFVLVVCQPWLYVPWLHVSQVLNVSEFNPNHVDSLVRDQSYFSVPRSMLQNKDPGHVMCELALT
uniref:Uncharacterized protein n=1 Tax=Sphaerodactylus townsendi TaxID=933632 RepID=A0ACB8E613_9SAUR